MNESRTAEFFSTTKARALNRIKQFLAAYDRVPVGIGGREKVTNRRIFAVNQTGDGPAPCRREKRTIPARPEVSIATSTLPTEPSDLAAISERRAARTRMRAGNSPPLAPM